MDGIIPVVVGVEGKGKGTEREGEGVLLGLDDVPLRLYSSVRVTD